jgi:hypothetical protein
MSIIIMFNEEREYSIWSSNQGNITKTRDVEFSLKYARLSANAFEFDDCGKIEYSTSDQG